MVRSVNRVYNAPLRQRKVNKDRGLTMPEHCTFAFAALYNGPLLAPINPENVRPKCVTGRKCQNHGFHAHGTR